MTDVILVDEAGREIGTMEKLEAHQKGLLHRAISVFVFHPDGRVMLQKRADDKYHSGGLWSNTCCSHPMPGESTRDAAKRRLKEEMGIDCELAELGTFTYRTEFESGLTEHEFDHVFTGTTSLEPTLNRDEAQDWKWQNVAELREDIRRRSELYASWLPMALELVINIKS